MERETITLEARAQHRLSVLNHLLTGEITAVEAAAYLEATLSSHQDTRVNPNRDDWPSARSAAVIALSMPAVTPSRSFSVVRAARRWRAPTPAPTATTAARHGADGRTFAPTNSTPV